MLFHDKHHHGKGNMKRQPEKRPQMDTESSTIPSAPAIDGSPAAKMQAVQNDGSKPLTPHSMTILPELTEERGPYNLLMGKSATASEAHQVPQTTPCKNASTQETMTAQTIPKHDQKPTIPPTRWSGALECTWPARLPLPALFRDEMPSSTAPPTLPTLPTSPRPTRHTRKTLPTHEHIDGQHRVLLVSRAPQPRTLPLHARSLPLPPRHPPRLMVRVKIWNSLAPND